MIAVPIVGFVNHLLEEEAWARDRLAPFAGKRVRVTATPLPDLALAIREGGLLAPAPSGAPDLVIALQAAALPGLARRDESVLQGIAFTGDADLAAAVQFLFRHLEWQVEEDLSRVVGDVAAHRIVGAGREFLAWQKDAAERLGQNLAEYLTEEAGVLAPAAERARFARDVAELADAVERLEKRLDYLARALDGARAPPRGVG